MLLLCLFLLLTFVTDSTSMTAKGVYEEFDSEEDDVKNINDSGTESNEDQSEAQIIENNTRDSDNKEAMTEVQITLSRLESELAKSNNKDNVQGLLNKLKSYLNVKNNTDTNDQPLQSIPTPPPRKYHKNRHSLAVTQDDMATVRGLLNQYSTHDANRTDTQHVTSPVHQQDLAKNVFHIKNDEGYSPISNLNNSDSNNKNLVHIQKDIHNSNRTTNNVGKQSILKQSSLDVYNNKNDNIRNFQKQSSLDSDYNNVNTRLDQSNEMRMGSVNPSIKPYSHVHYTPNMYTVESNETDKPLVATLKLRETNITTDDADDGDISSDDDENIGGNNIRNARKLLKFAKNEIKSKQLIRSNKKIKMKRSNTIDIPKNMKYFSSGDELANDDRTKAKTPTFVPKTENDFKFLAFLRRNNTDDTKCYNSAARGGAHWSNRFSCIKTTFENAEKQNAPAPQPKKSQAKLFWQKSEEKMGQNGRLPWTISEDPNKVVTGSLVVQTKPKQTFTHAVKSPFQAVQSIPQTKTSYTGTVKQMANEKFNKPENIDPIDPRLIETRGVNVKVTQIERHVNDRRPENQNNIFSSISATTHRNFVPEQSNFKPIPQRSDSSQNYKPIVQPVHPYQNPQVSNYSNGQTGQFVKKQFLDPQYQTSQTKAVSSQQGMNAYKQSMYDSPKEFHHQSGIFSPYQDRTPGFDNNPRNFQVPNENPTGFYESQISPYEPSVVEIHKSPLCTKNGSHFTPISPAVVDGISYEPQTVALSRVMGKEQCQQAVIVNKSNKHHFNESTNVLKNIISQHQASNNQAPPLTPDEDSQYPPISTANLPSNTSYVYPTPVNRPNVTVQPMNFSSSASAQQTFHNYPPAPQINSSSYQYPPHQTAGTNFNPHAQSKAQSYQQYPYSQPSYQPDSNRFTPHEVESMYNTQSHPHASVSSVKNRPNSMYNNSEDYNPHASFSGNPIYSSNNTPYALTGSKSSSSVYPSVLSPVNYSYKSYSTNVKDRSYPSIPSDQFGDSRHKFVSNNVTSFERATSQPPRNISSNNNSNTPYSSKSNTKPSGVDSKISYMNYISQISPKTMQSKLDFSPGRKSISPSYHNSSLGQGELSQSSTQSSISDNSPINKLNSPHMNLSTPSSPQLPAPPILTKTPQLKISSKTAFVPVKPFNQALVSPSIPKQNLKLPPSSPSSSCISPSGGFMSPTASSPQMPSVLQKSESWHQMVLDRMAPKNKSPIMSGSGKLLPKAKSSHSLNFAKQFEAAIPDTIEKKKTVEAYLNMEGSKKEINKYNFKQFKKTKTTKSSSSTNKSVVPLSDNLDNVDEAFDSLFNSSK